MYSSNTFSFLNNDYITYLFDRAMNLADKEKEGITATIQSFDHISTKKIPFSGVFFSADVS